MNNDDGHNCVFVQKKINERERESEIDLTLSRCTYELVPFFFRIPVSRREENELFLFPPSSFFYIINLALSLSLSLSFAYGPQPH
jgi:hypothetical protein